MSVNRLILSPCPIRVMIITGKTWSVTAHWEADELAGPLNPYKRPVQPNVTD